MSGPPGRGGPQLIPRPDGWRPGDPAPWAGVADRTLTLDRVLAAVEDHHRRLAAGKGLVGRRARRYDAEVRARLGHLLEDAVGHLLTGEPAGGRSSETPVAAARRLAGRLLAGGEHG